MGREYGRRFWWVLCALWLAVILAHSLMSAELSAAESGSSFGTRWIRARFVGMRTYSAMAPQ